MMRERREGDRAADAACRVLLKLGINRFPVDPLDILRRCRNTRVMTFQEAAEAMALTEDDLSRLCSDAEAMTIRDMGADEDRYLVCYRTDGNRARLNFTLAHELGHIILRHNRNTQEEEKEADCFASHLLCPVIASELVTNEKDLARLCYISHSAAQYALQRKSWLRNEKLDRQMRGYIDDYISRGGRHLLEMTND